MSELAFAGQAYWCGDNDPRKIETGLMKFVVKETLSTRGVCLLLARGRPRRTISCLTFFWRFNEVNHLGRSGKRRTIA